MQIYQMPVKNQIFLAFIYTSGFFDLVDIFVYARALWIRISCISAKSLPIFIFGLKEDCYFPSKIKYFDKGSHCIILPLFLNEFCKKYNRKRAGYF